VNKAVNDRLGAWGKALKRLFLFLTILMAKKVRFYTHQQKYLKNFLVF